MKARIATLIRHPRFWASVVGLLVTVGLVAAVDEAALTQALQTVAEGIIHMFTYAGG